MDYTIRHSLFSVIRPSRCFGLFPFNLTEKSVVLSIPLTVCAIIIHLLLIFASILSIFIPSREVEVDTIYEALMNTQIAALQSALIAHLIWLLLCRRKLEEVFQILFNLEAILPFKKKIAFKYPRMFFIVLILVFFASFAVKVLTTQVDFFDLVSITTFYLLPGLLFTSIFQFTGLLSICRNFFRALTMDIKTPSYLAENIENSIDTFDQLVSCCETINYCFGPLLLIALISLFVIMTSCFYICYLAWSAKVVVLMCGFWACFFLNTARYLAHSCWKTVITANQFYTVLYKVIIKDRSIADDHYYKFLLDFVNKRELKFTAFGYFSIDYGMISSMVGTSATYLIILIQFSKEEEKNPHGEDWFFDSEPNANSTTEVYSESSTEFNYTLY